MPLPPPLRLPPAQAVLLGSALLLAALAPGTAAGAGAATATDSADLSTAALGLSGRIEGDAYVSPTGVFSVDIPVRRDLGGGVGDDERAVWFEDDYGTYECIAAYPITATLQTELTTRGMKGYLAYFFTAFVLPQLQQTYPGAGVDGGEGRYYPALLPGVNDGALLACVLLPGGSHFANRSGWIEPPPHPPVAKNGYLVFVRNGYTFAVSTELYERVTEGALYTKTPAEEEALLKARLKTIVGHMHFSPSVAAAP